MQTVVCPRCKHKWEYKGSAWWITCPVCRKLLKNTKKEVRVQ